jgi:hypothetical protein
VTGGISMISRWLGRGSGTCGVSVGGVRAPDSPFPFMKTVPREEPNLLRALRPARWLTPLSARSLASGRVFASSASLVCPPCPACRAKLRPRNVYRRPFSPRLREKPAVG